MSVNLSKGGSVSLTKQAPDLTAVAVGLGWDARTTSGYEYDLDASALVCGSNGRVLSDSHFVFFNNLESPEGSVVHTGDELSGGAAEDEDEDEETIKVDLTLVPRQASRIVFPVSIHEADRRGQNFGQISNAYIRVVDQATDRELARYNLTEDASNETAIVFGELCRYNDEWQFRAVGQGCATGLHGIVVDHGVNVA